MKFPLIGGSARSGAQDVNPQRTVNMYIHADKEAGVDSLKSMPGLARLRRLKTNSTFFYDWQTYSGVGNLTYNGDTRDAWLHDEFYLALYCQGDLSGVTFACSDDDENEDITGANNSTSFSTIEFDTGVGDFTITPNASFSGDNKVAVGLIAFSMTSFRGEEVRGLHEMDGTLYVVFGNALLSVDTDNVVTVLNADSPMGTWEGAVTMAFDEYGNLMVCDGSTDAYLYDGSTFYVLNEADYDFLGGGSVAHSHGYFISHRPNSNEFYISSVLNDKSEFDPLDKTVVTTDDPGDIVRVFVNLGDLWIFKQKTALVYRITTDSDQPWQPYNNGYLSVGCAAANSVVGLDNAVFWLADDRTVRRSSGLNSIIVSDAVSYEFNGYSTVSDAIGFAYEMDGKSFYQLTFPTEDKTWVYEVSANKWYERESYKETGGVGRHRANCYAKFNGNHVVGDFCNGYLYTLDRDTFTDNAQAMIRRRVSGNLEAKDREILTFNRLEVFFEPGVGIASGQGSDPQAMLKYSKNGGNTWSHERWVGIGAAGEYENRAVWWQLGSGHRLGLDISVSDPVDVTILGASLDVEKNQV